MIRIEIRAADAVTKEMKKLAKAYPKGFSAALYKLGVAILGDALPRVPVETGLLRASGYVAKPNGGGTNATVEMGFGTVYAVPQHERLDYRHPRGGEAKYLEKAVNAVTPRALPLLAKWTIENKDHGFVEVGGVPSSPFGFMAGKKQKPKKAPTLGGKMKGGKAKRFTKAMKKRRPRR